MICAICKKELVNYGESKPRHVDGTPRCQYTDKERIKILAANLVAAELEKYPISTLDPLYKQKMHVVVKKCVEDAHQALVAVDEFLCG